MERVSTGIELLDDILGGGFVRNSINVIAGSPGAGKTILAQQIAFASAARQPRVAVYLSTVSEPLDKLLTFLQRHRFADPGLIGSRIHYESLERPLAESAALLPQRIADLIREHSPSVVIIDSLKAVADLMADPADWRRMLFETASVLSAYDTTAFWVGEYGPGASEHHVEFAIADGILELRREFAGARDDRFLRVLKLRGSDFRSGSHTFTISDDGLSVYPRLVAPTVAGDYRPRAERLQTGIDGLDTMVESGWLRGTSTLIAGPSGAGKTVLGLHFLRRGVQDGEPGILLNFQENPVQLDRMMRSLDWDPDELLAPGGLDSFYVSPVELHIDTIVDELFRRIEATGARRLVIDAIADLERTTLEPGRFRDYLYALTQHLAHRNVTTMLVLETPESPNVASWTRHEMSYMSDNLLALSMTVGDDLTRTVQLLKSRGSAHDGRRRVLEIGRGGIAIR